MRCSNCGREITNKIIRINGVLLCENCARLSGSDQFMDPLKFFDNELPNMLSPLMSELEFSPTRTQIVCSKCGTSLRDLESGRKLGCIECYNTFNESIMRALMRTQANTAYKGRKPGDASEFVKETSIEKSSQSKEGPSILDTAEKQTKEPEQKTPAPEKNILEEVRNADLSQVSVEDLNKAMQCAIEIEDYSLAAKIRDEIKGRGEN